MGGAADSGRWQVSAPTARERLKQIAEGMDEVRTGISRLAPNRALEEMTFLAAALHSALDALEMTRDQVEPAHWKQSHAAAVLADINTIAARGETGGT